MYRLWNYFDRLKVEGQVLFFPRRSRHYTMAVPTIKLFHRSPTFWRQMKAAWNDGWTRA